MGSALAALLLVVSVGLIYSIFGLYRDHLHEERVLKPVATDLLETKKEADAILNSYGQVDPDQGIYRIPIERAMDLMLKENGGQR